MGWSGVTTDIFITIEKVRHLGDAMNCSCILYLELLYIYMKQATGLKWTFSTSIDKIIQMLHFPIVVPGKMNINWRDEIKKSPDRVHSPFLFKIAGTYLRQKCLHNFCIPSAILQPLFRPVYVFYYCCASQYTGIFKSGILLDSVKRYLAVIYVCR